jgi:hypothetical protein
MHMMDDIEVKVLGVCECKYTWAIMDTAIISSIGIEYIYCFKLFYKIIMQ